MNTCMKPCVALYFMIASYITKNANTTLSEYYSTYIFTFRCCTLNYTSTNRHAHFIYIAFAFAMHYIQLHYILHATIRTYIRIHARQLPAEAFRDALCMNTKKIPLQLHDLCHRCTRTLIGSCTYARRRFVALHCSTSHDIHYMYLNSVSMYIA